MKKKQTFGFFSIILLGINAIIGSGIFLLPGQAYAKMGTSSLFIYLLVSLLAIALAMCFAEVAGMFKRNGGAYVYVKEAFGDFAGFEVGIMKWIVSIIAWATMAVGFVTALSSLWPSAKDPMIHSILVSVLLIGLAIINILGVKITKYVNNIVTIGKLLPLLLFIGMGVFYLHGDYFFPILPSEVSSSTLSETVLLIFYAFTGFEAIASAAEDMENPKKTLPLAILFAMFFVSILYFLIQMVSIGTLGGALADSVTPLADAISIFLGPMGKTIVALGTLISIGGINIASSFLTPRNGVALAEDGLLPHVIAKKSSWGTPYIAILCSVAIALPIALSGSFTQLAAISVISRFTQYIPTCLSVIVFRKKRPDLTSTFRVPFGYTIPILATLVSLWLLFHADIEKLMIGLGAMILAIPLYFIMKRWQMRT